MEAMNKFFIRNIFIEIPLTKNTRAPMISVVDENMIIGTAIHNLPTASCKSRSISKDYGKKVVGSNICSSIILHATRISTTWSAGRSHRIISNRIRLPLWKEILHNLWHSTIHIAAIRIVNDNSRPRVLFIESNVIIHENNNVFIFQPTSFQDLIGMTNISLRRRSRRSYI